MTTTIKNSSDMSLKHTALRCTDLVAELFGKTDRTAVLSAAEIITSSYCLGSDDVGLRTTALLTLATMVDVLQDAFIPIIAHSLPLSLEYLGSSLEEDAKDPRLHKACCTFISSLFLYIPFMVTQDHLESFLNLSHESADADMGGDYDADRVETLALMAKRADPKECFIALDKTWNNAVENGLRAIREHLEVLRSLIERQPKSLIIKYSDILIGFFIKALDLRRIQLSPRTEDSYEDDEIEEVDEAVNGTLIKVIYKLNDAVFRPLFEKMMEWASSSASKKGKGPNLYRRVAWYTFLSRFFEDLKVGCKILMDMLVCC